MDTAIESWPLAVVAVFVVGLFATLWYFRREVRQETGRDPARAARAIDSARRAVAAKERRARPRVLARARMQLAMLLAEVGGRAHDRAQLLEAQALLADIIPIFTAQGLTPELASAIYYRGRVEWGLGGLQPGPEGLEQAVATFRELLGLEPWPRHLLRAVVVSLPAVILMDIGIRRDNEAAMQDGVALAREGVRVARARVPIERCIALRNLSHCLGLLGAHKRDQALLEEAIEIAQTAADCIRAAVHPRQWVACKANLGHALGELGRLRGDPGLIGEGLAALAEAAELGASNTQTEGRTMLCMNNGNLRLTLGMMTGDRPALEAAREDLKLAQSLFADSGQLFPAAEAGLLLGEALAALGNRAGAREHLESALAVFTEAAAPGQIEEAKDALARLDGAPGAPRGASHIPVYQVR